MARKYSLQIKQSSTLPFYCLLNGCKVGSQKQARRNKKDQKAFHSIQLRNFDNCLRTTLPDKNTYLKYYVKAFIYFCICFNFKWGCVLIHVQLFLLVRIPLLTHVLLIFLSLNGLYLLSPMYCSFRYMGEYGDSFKWEMTTRQNIASKEAARQCVGA